MPNIELHGITARMHRGLRKRVEGLIQEAPYAHEVVITWVDSVVRGLVGTPQPFLRILATKGKLDEHLDSMLTALAPLGMDIEVQELRKFVPKNVAVDNQSSTAGDGQMSRPYQSD